MRKTDRKLKRAFLLGRGISNSLSPVIQNAAFREVGINAIYNLEDLKRRSLGSFMSTLKSNDTLGFNVTSPFKEEIMKYLSSIDSRSETIGAVNTVKIRERQDGMRGFNTDYDGILATLEKLGALRKSATQKSALILGAGGAARACICALLINGYSNLTILNRTAARALNLSEKFGRLSPKTDIKTATLTTANFKRTLENCGLIINTISRSNSKYFPVNLDFSQASEDTKVFDLGYKEESLFLKMAKRNSLKTADGLLMLVTQAAKSFEIWTERKAPIRLMIHTARNALQNSI